MNLYQYEAMHQPWGGDPESRWTRTYDMPFAAIGAAFATVGTAITAGAAAAGGAMAVAGAALTVVATVATVAGLAMTIVGAATGNQDLMKIGGIIGIAGGVASIASGVVNASVQAGTAAAAQGTASATAAVGSNATNAAANAITPTFASQAGQAAAAVAPSTIQNAATSAITPAFQSAVGAGVANVAPAAATGVLNTAAQSSIAPALESATTTGVGATGTNIAGSMTAPTGVGSAMQTGSYFQNLQAPNALLELGKIGSGMLQGANQSSNFEAGLDLQKEQLGLSKDQFEFTKQKYADQQRNANFQGQMSFSATPVSPKDATAYKNTQASNAAAQGAILTGSKPTATPA